MPHKSPGKSDREGLTLVHRSWTCSPTRTRRASGLRLGCGPTGGTARAAAVWTPLPRRIAKCPTGVQVVSPTFRCESALCYRTARFRSGSGRWRIYLHLTSLKGVSSLKLHRDIGVSQKTAWFMLHRLREAARAKCGLFSGPVEFDETYFWGRRKNMSNTKRRAALKTGRGPVGKTAVLGAKDRATKQVEAKVIKSADG